jgi:hypothetical protein
LSVSQGLVGVSDQRVLRTGGGYMWDYWFTNDGILRMQLISRKLQLGVYTLVWVIFFVVALLLFGGYFLMLPFSIIFVVAFYLTGGALLRRIARNRRRNLEAVPPGEGGEIPRSSVSMGWDAVTRIELRRDRVRIFIGNRLYDTKVRELARTNELKELASSKLGDRLVVM